MIYFIKNDVNDKLYVGSTIQTYWKRWQQHQRDMKDPERENNKLYTAMRELGVEHFYMEVHDYYPCGTKEELEEIETRVILEYDTIDNGYNYKRAHGRARECNGRVTTLATLNDTTTYAMSIRTEPTPHTCMFTVTF